jgi:putative ABC transport system permease protein
LAVSGARAPADDHARQLAELAALAICGAVPRRVLRRTSVADVMCDGARSTAGVQPRRVRQVLVGAQLAFTIVLLVLATLVVRSFDALRRIDLGFVSDDVLAIRVDPQRPPTAVNAWMSQLLDTLSRRDAIAEVGAVYLRPLALGPIGQGTTVLLDGQPDTPATTESNPLLNYQVATAGYFRTMRIPVLAGRTFTDEDRAGAERVVVVGKSTAERLWPGQPAVGKRLRTASFAGRPGAPHQAWRRVVGVVADVRYRGLTEVSLDLYDPATQSSMGVTDLVLRARVDLPTAVAIVRDEARRLAPEALVDEVTTLDAVVQRARAPWRFGAWIFTLFAVAAAGLAALGLFGLVALDVTERRREFAVRQAMGATSARIAQTVVASTAGAVVAGGSLGLVGALAAATMIRGVLVAVPVTDAWTYLVAVVAVAALVAAASMGPARRAMLTSPAAALRQG